MWSKKWKELYMNKVRRKRGLNRIKKLALKRAVEEIRAKYGERAIMKGWKPTGGTKMMEIWMIG